jgi:hypothetical protein
MIKKSLLLVLVAVVVAGVVSLGGCKKSEPQGTQGTAAVEKSATVTAKYVNTKCPIMGSIIKPEDVTEDLVRDYKGQKVAFCCGMCPSKWDALPDAEKVEKLVASK